MFGGLDGRFHLIEREKPTKTIIQTTVKIYQIK